MIFWKNTDFSCQLDPARMTELCFNMLIYFDPEPESELKLHSGSSSGSGFGQKFRLQLRKTNLLNTILPWGECADISPDDSCQQQTNFAFALCLFSV